MFGTGRKIVAGMVVGAAALFAAGCQDTSGGHANHVGASDKAVMCSKCQVTYFEDSLGKGSPVKYTSSKMECPDCKSAAASYFSTGKLEHSCKTCGPDALAVCELHR